MERSSFLCVRLLLHQRHPEAEARTAPWRAGRFDAAAVHGENRARNRQPHSRALAHARAALAAIKLVEDHGQIVWVDARAVVLYGKFQPVGGAPAAQRY